MFSINKQQFAAYANKPVKIQVIQVTKQFSARKNKKGYFSILGHTL